MQTSVTDAYATALAKALYVALDSHPGEPVARALARARQQVADDQARQAQADRRPVRPECGAHPVHRGRRPGADRPGRTTTSGTTLSTQRPQGQSVRELPIGYLIGRRHSSHHHARADPHKGAIDEHGPVSGAVLCGPVEFPERLRSPAGSHQAAAAGLGRRDPRRRLDPPSSAKHDSSPPSKINPRWPAPVRMSWPP